MIKPRPKNHSSPGLGDGEELHVHRAVLAANSKVFQRCDSETLKNGPPLRKPIGGGFEDVFRVKFIYFWWVNCSKMEATFHPMLSCCRKHIVGIDFCWMMADPEEWLKEVLRFLRGCWRVTWRRRWGVAMFAVAHMFTVSWTVTIFLNLKWSVLGSTPVTRLNEKPKSSLHFWLRFFHDFRCYFCQKPFGDHHISLVHGFNMVVSFETIKQPSNHHM